MVIEARRFGDLVELVGRGELDVAVGIVEELGKLRFQWRHDDDLWYERPEQRGCLLYRFRRRPADNLRHRFQLRNSVALHDTLRTKGNVDLPTALSQVAVDPIGGARKNRGAKHQKL